MIGFLLVPVFLLIFGLLALGIQLYRRLRKEWKLYAIPAYLTLCFWGLFCIPIFLERKQHPLTWSNWREVLPWLWVCLSIHYGNHYRSLVGLNPTTSWSQVGLQAIKTLKHSDT
jgi:hypothetical protein